MELRLELLSVTRRMDHVVDIVVAKDGRFGCRIADPVVALSHGLWAQEIVGRGEQGLIIHVRDQAHFAQADVGAIGDHAGYDRVPVQRCLHVALKNMRERIQALATGIDELEQLGNVNLGHFIEEGIVGRFLNAHIGQRPGDHTPPVFAQLDMRIFSRQDAPVYLFVLGFQFLFHLLENLCHRLRKQRGIDVLKYFLLILLPDVLRNQVFVEAAKAQ